MSEDPATDLICSQAVFLIPPRTTTVSAIFELSFLNDLQSDVLSMRNEKDEEEQAETGDGDIL